MGGEGGLGWADLQSSVEASLQALPKEADAQGERREEDGEEDGSGHEPEAKDDAEQGQDEEDVQPREVCQDTNIDLRGDQREASADR